MTDINCESISVAAMALVDGEEAPFSKQQIEEHLLSCHSCREETERLSVTNRLLSSQTRLWSQVNVWPHVNERIEATVGNTQSFDWRMLLIFGIPLFSYKIFVLLVQVAPSLWSKFVPIVLVIVIFAYLKTNPFKINCELRLEGETTS